MDWIGLGWGGVGWGCGRGCGLIVIPLPWCPCDAVAASLPCWTLGLGEGLLVGVLLGVNLFIEEVRRQLIAIINLQLRRGKETECKIRGKQLINN